MHGVITEESNIIICYIHVGRLHLSFDKTVGLSTTQYDFNSTNKCEALDVML